MDWYMLVVYMKELIKTGYQHSLFPEYFGVTLLRPQQVVAEWWLMDDSLPLDVGGVLTPLDFASRES